MANGGQKTNINDSCRFCLKNLRIRGVIAHSVQIFDRPKQDKPVFERFAELGLVLVNNSSKSTRMCKNCQTLVLRLERDQTTFNGWKQQEHFNDHQLPPSTESATTPSAATTEDRLTSTDKRQRDTPSKTPRAIKKICHPRPPESKTRKSITQVISQFPSKTVVKVSSHAEAGIIQHVTNQNWKTAANLIASHQQLMGEIKMRILWSINDECRSLSKPENSFILWKTSPEDLRSFSFDGLQQDFQRLSPFLLSIFKQISCNSLPTACAALSIALRGREPRMSAFAYYINSILQHGGAKKAAFTRLCKIGITTTHGNAVGKQKELASMCGDAIQTLKVDNEVFLNSQVASNIGEVLEDLSLSEHDAQLGELPFSHLTDTNADTDLSHPPSTRSSSLQGLPPTYTIVFDNLDFYMKAHHQSAAHGNKSLHWIHHIAVEDRIPINHLSSARPKVDISTYDLCLSLPDSEVQGHIRREFIVLGSRVLTKYVDAFKPMANVVVHHMPHLYSQEMSDRSTDFPLGLLFKNENKTGELIDVLQHLQKEYVPKGLAGVSQVLVGGDRLTEANCRNIQWAFADGATDEDRLEGLAFTFEDWHAVRNLMQIHYKIFFRQDSTRDHGTVNANMNVLRCSNAKQGSMTSYDAYKNFLQTDTTALFLAAAMEQFGLHDLTETPADFIPEDICSGSTERKRHWLNQKTAEVVDKYVMLSCVDQYIKMQKGPFTCHQEGCSKKYMSEKTLQKHEMDKHNLSPQLRLTTPDHIKQHSEARLGFGFLLLNMLDAVKEGDGGRLMRLYKVALLFYKAYGHSNYAYSTFLLTLQLNATLSPRMAHSVVWNRFWNGRGGKGKNIPMDLHLEHLNNYLKSFLKGVGPNLNEVTARRVSCSLGILKEMMDNTDRELEVTTPSGIHKAITEITNVHTLVSIFTKEEIFKNKPGRAYKSFPLFSKNLLAKFSYSDLCQWMRAKLKDWRKVPL